MVKQLILGDMAGRWWHLDSGSLVPESELGATALRAAAQALAQKTQTQATGGKTGARAGLSNTGPVCPPTAPDRQREGSSL